MIFNIISRANYSTGVTQEFLQNILARAQEATAKKTATASSGAMKMNWKNNRKNMNRTGKGKLNGSNQSSNSQQQQTGTVSSRVNLTFNHSIVNKQPQFKRKTASKVHNPALSDDLIDAFETTKVSNRRIGGRKPANAYERKSSRSRSVQGSAKRTKDENKRLGFPPPKPKLVQEAYVPQEPTPLSLLKYHPNLPNTASSRIVSYSLNIMKSANFPLFRRANYGLATNVQESPESIALSVMTPYFGRYMPASSLILEKEKLFKNLTIMEDKPMFDSAVLGKYEELKPLEKSDFNSIAKSEKKRQELTFNADVARHGLQSNILDPEIKENTYQVCVGLKGLSEL